MWTLLTETPRLTGVSCWITAVQGILHFTITFNALHFIHADPMPSNFVVWMHALRNKHFLVALATLIGLLALTFQPLAAALLTTKDTWWHAPGLFLYAAFEIRKVTEKSVLQNSPSKISLPLV
jgi:hypothetical protein